ncbi:methyltransferase domain-containing protein [Flagellimonas meishanensis]|uniref:methyltransferase domain-containing protein n=1 Tax=Flagellimonas meishanensis TaxID=2873264 RepID=UPI001CA7B318|nr:methyltransferase domain-containing protein [[Muricauda] meishanensis]
MSDLNLQIEQHYSKKGLFEAILNRLKQNGIDLESVERAHIAGVDEFHVRGAAVSRELAQQIDLRGLEVLDVGCGLGGACRMLSDEFDCNTTGVDLSTAYVQTANALSKLVKLDHKTRFFVAEATNLPFPDASFDVVWTQHVQMNVPDKEMFYTEIKRVLKPSGFFLYYDIFKKNDKKVEYPMPWASTSEYSFLFRKNDMELILTNLGFEKISTVDQTEAGISFFEGLIPNIKNIGNQKVSLNILMGETTQPKLLNLMQHLKNESLMLESGVYKIRIF